MFIAHLPAGYLLSKYFKSKIETNLISWKTIIFIGLLGSILPDLDLLYFYLLDDRQHQHHSYWTHIPIFWLGIYACTASVFIAVKNKKLLLISTFLFCDIILHLILDTVSGGILWSYPLNSQYFVLLTISPQYNWWLLNFIFHWSFALELLILSLVLLFYMKSNSNINNEPGMLKNEA